MSNRLPLKNHVQCVHMCSEIRLSCTIRTQNCSAERLTKLRTPSGCTPPSHATTSTPEPLNCIGGTVQRHPAHHNRNVEHARSFHFFSHGPGSAHLSVRVPQLCPCSGLCGRTALVPEIRAPVLLEGHVSRVVSTANPPIRQLLISTQGPISRKTGS